MVFNEGQFMQCIVMCATGIRLYVKSVLRCTVLIFGTYHTRTLYLRQQWCGGSVVILRSWKG